MSIGAVLADARWRSRLTVSEVSHETRIKESIIWAIENDDFAACGGDAYARGHIRAIARAVGTDPDPLIQEYDATVRTMEDIEEVVVLHPDAAAARTLRQRRLARGALSLAVLAVLAIAGWAAYQLAATGGRPAGGNAAAGRPGSQPAAPGPAVSRPAASVPGASRPAASRPAGVASAGTPRPSPASTPSGSPAPAHGAAAPVVVAVQVLTPVKAVAFGAGGTATGDNPHRAAAAIDGNHATAWRTDWYTTAAFGNLKRGTGLLLDMGRRVTITSAQIMLGGTRGADVQLRAGNVPALASLHETASAADAGGNIGMWLTAPVRAKYILIWFTRLPPDARGTFQASIYEIHVHGHS